MSLITQILIVAASLAALGWLALVVRMAINCYDQHPVEPIDDPLPDDIPEIDAIVAARNEEREIADAAHFPTGANVSPDCESR